VVLEACLLPKSTKLFDFWLPRWGIAVEVDGRQHFVGGMHDATAQAQQSQDRRIDKLAKKHKLRLLRLHYADDKQWKCLLQGAIQKVQRNPHCWFIERTASYAYDGAA
jgi:very-short-patch-repair endonuclease